MTTAIGTLFWQTL